MRALVGCVIVSLALFTFSCQTGDSGPLGTIRGAFQTVTTPVRYLGAAVSAPIRGLGNIFSNLTADQATLTELQSEVSELRARNAELEEDAAAAGRLRDLLDLRDTSELQSIAANVIAGSTDSWSSTVTIDKGSSSGVTAGMPVIASSGVVGQVISCGAASSTVRLLSDGDSSISAMVQSSRAQGMLEGSASGEVRLTLVRTNQDVAVGDVIVTSGLGGVFPKGLPIGEVSSVESNPGDIYLTITVDLYADPTSVEEVLVVTSLTEEQRASAEDIAEADAQERDDSVSSGQSSDAGETGDSDGGSPEEEQTTGEG